MKINSAYWLVATLCFVSLPTIARGDEDPDSKKSIDLEKIVESDAFKAIKLNPLIAIHDRKEPAKAIKNPTPAQISEAKTKASKVYAMLMDGTVPDFEVDQHNPYLVQGFEGDVSARFRFTENGILHNVDISSYQSVANPNPKFPFRLMASEAKPEELFQEIFGRAPIGVKEVVGSGDWGWNMEWQAQFQNDVTLSGYSPKTTAVFSNGKSGTRGWYFDGGMTPAEFGLIGEAIKNNPLEIGFDQAIATTIKAARSVGLPIVPEAPEVGLHYHFPPSKTATIVWIAGNRPDIDGTKPIFGIRVFFRSWTGFFGDPVIAVSAMIDPRNGEVLYLSNETF